jgi:two-component system response regulator VicR
MSKRRILIADDDADVVDAMSIILKSGGHEIFEAYSGEETLAKFAESKPEIIFLDLMMEKFDTGITVCRKIRETDRDVKIYLVSAVGEETANTIDTHETGFNGALSKPVSPEELLELVD